MKVYTYRAIIEKDEGGYYAFVPTLPGCFTIGDTIEETKKNLREAIQCHIESLLIEEFIGVLKK